MKLEIVDFGLYDMYFGKNYEKNNKFRGTPKYMPPEPLFRI